CWALPSLRAKTTRSSSWIAMIRPGRRTAGWLRCACGLLTLTDASLALTFFAGRTHRLWGRKICGRGGYGAEPFTQKGASACRRGPSAQPRARCGARERQAHRAQPAAGAGWPTCRELATTRPKKQDAVAGEPRRPAWLFGSITAVADHPPAAQRAAVPAAEAASAHQDRTAAPEAQAASPAEPVVWEACSSPTAAGSTGHPSARTTLPAAGSPDRGCSTGLRPAGERPPRPRARPRPPSGPSRCRTTT